MEEYDVEDVVVVVMLVAVMVLFVVDRNAAWPEAARAEMIRDT